MSSLPEEMRAQNLMCYIGHEGTYTPAHREMCASLGQNIMVEASRAADGEVLGSSIWFMTESKEREVVREYFLSMLGHDIEIEKHFAQINAWKKAPFDVHVVEQRQGDFILIPPLAAHQVWNRGTRTMKVAWNRTTVETLELALQEALPKARLVCRDEQYKNKAIIYYSLVRYYTELQNMEENAALTELGLASLGQDTIRNSPRAKQLMADFRKLFGLFTQILVDEMFVFKEKDVEFIPFDSCITCSYCRSNIFNRFLTCKNCVRTLINGDEDTYDVCMECYAMGRSCACLSGLKWCEQWQWNELVDSYETWRGAVISNDGFIDIANSPQPIEVARQRSGKKSVAQICQEALRRRPWKDITQPEREGTPSDSGLEPDEEDVKKKAKKKRKKKRGQLERCHVCCHKDYSYRVQKCSNADCTESYCYGVLYRAFDMMPQKVLENENWLCPKCLGICNCGYCRRTGNTNAYMPKNTSLGHDTRRVADDRSVEALVDFRLHNLSWLKATGEESRSRNTMRMQRLREQASSAKARDLVEEAGAENEEVDGAMQTGSVPQGESVAVRLQAPITNGHEGFFGGRHPSEIRDANAGPENTQDGVEHMLSFLATAEGIPLPNEESMSSYPDPSIFGPQRIGMGYYEQDDTPDKILFDPYQAPSADALHRDRSDVPEFVKKSIRAAKRKAKKDNEDPDFVVRSQKRPRPAPGADFLASMDPALFTESTTALENGNQELPGAASEQGDAGAADAPQQRHEATNATHSALRYDANEPTLRHAKPKASYVEFDDVDVEETEPFGQETQEFQSMVTGAAENLQDEVELATDAARDECNQNKEQRQDEIEAKDAEKETRPVSGKRRGRPPRRVVNGEAENNAGSSGDPTGAGQPEGRKARSNSEESGSGSESDAELPVRRKPGRPARGSARSVRARGRGGRGGARGRPGRSEAPPRTSQTEKNQKANPADQQFMSLAERMALRGKKIKIGTRNPQSSLANTTETATKKQDRSGSAIGVEVRVSAVPAGVTETSQTWQPITRGAEERPRSRTVVRLSNHGPDGGESIVASGSDSGSSDDEDIPARVGTISRGAASRGRGRGRGRPRGGPFGKGR
jgi:hypothetical protein